MTNDPKEKKEFAEYLETSSPERHNNSVFRSGLNALQNGNLFHIIAGSLQVIMGLGILAVSILGLLSPGWLSGIMSLMGSVSSMIGIYLIFHSVTSQTDFEDLINKSIKRVIRSQN